MKMYVTPTQLKKFNPKKNLALATNVAEKEGFTTMAMPTDPGSMGVR